jgi:hypothetical protein
MSRTGRFSCIRTILFATIVLLLGQALRADVTNHTVLTNATDSSTPALTHPTTLEWEQIILTPVFWIASIVGSLALSIIANLVTPLVSATLARRNNARRSGLREKQIKLRAAVVDLHANIHRRASAKLDAILLLLAAVVMMVVCIGLFQLATLLGQGARLLIALITVAGTSVGLAFVKVGMERFEPAVKAERRERAVENFVKGSGPASEEQLVRFEDEWDLREFGVTSKTTTEEGVAASDTKPG